MMGLLSVSSSARLLLAFFYAILPPPLPLQLFKMLLQIKSAIGAVSIHFQPGFRAFSVKDVLAWEPLNYLACIFKSITFAKT